MSDTVTLIVFGGSAMLMALVAGVFLAFSDFIMRSLERASPAAGIEAMQQINREVLSSVFVVWLMGLTPVCLGLAAYAWVYVDGQAQTWFIAGSLTYVVGTVLVTVLGNVPMNNRLDALRPISEETKAYWDIYATFWTAWNHVRTVAAAAGAIAILIGCALYI
ncbi:MAG: anthrone oxygenase family protein [Pseudomonadota bacterium]